MMLAGSRSYYDSYVRKTGTGRSLNDPPSLLTDRGAYLNFLEVQLERVSAACLGVQAYDDRFNDMQSLIVGLDERYNNMMKLLALSQSCTEELRQITERSLKDFSSRIDDKINQNRLDMENNSQLMIGNIEKRLTSLESKIESNSERFAASIEMLTSCLETNKISLFDMISRIESLESKTTDLNVIVSEASMSNHQKSTLQEEKVALCLREARDNTTRLDSDKAILLEELQKLNSSVTQKVFQQQKDIDDKIFQLHEAFRNIVEYSTETKTTLDHKLSSIESELASVSLHVNYILNLPRRRKTTASDNSLSGVTERKLAPLKQKHSPLKRVRIVNKRVVNVTRQESQAQLKQSNQRSQSQVPVIQASTQPVPTSSNLLKYPAKDNIKQHYQEQPQHHQCVCDQQPKQDKDRLLRLIAPYEHANLMSRCSKNNDVKSVVKSITFDDQLQPRYESAGDTKFLSQLNSQGQDQQRTRTEVAVDAGVVERLSHLVLQLEQSHYQFQTATPSAPTTENRQPHLENRNAYYLTENPATSSLPDAESQPTQLIHDPNSDRFNLKSARDPMQLNSYPTHKFFERLYPREHMSTLSTEPQPAGLSRFQTLEKEQTIPQSSEAQQPPNAQSLQAQHPPNLQSWQAQPSQTQAPTAQSSHALPSQVLLSQLQLLQSQPLQAQQTSTWSSQVQSPQGQSWQAQSSQPQPSQAQPSQAQPSQAQPQHGQSWYPQSQAQSSYEQLSQAHQQHEQSSQAQSWQAQPSQAQHTPTWSLQAQSPLGQPTQAQPTQAQPSQAQPSQAHPCQAHPSQAHPSQAHLSQAHHTQANSLQLQQRQAQQSHAQQPQSSSRFDTRVSQPSTRDTRGAYDHLDGGNEQNIIKHDNSCHDYQNDSNNVESEANTDSFAYLSYRPKQAPWIPCKTAQPAVIVNKSHVRLSPTALAANNIKHKQSKNGRANAKSRPLTPADKDTPTKSSGISASCCRPQALIEVDHDRYHKNDMTVESSSHTSVTSTSSGTTSSSFRHARGAAINIWRPQVGASTLIHPTDHLIGAGAVVNNM